MISDKRNFSEPPFTATLVISIENTISDLNVFFQATNSIKNRFGCNITFIFKKPELLFFNKKLLHAVSNAEVNRTLITDTPDLIWLDLMEFAKRQETEYVFFAEAESLVTEWHDALKFFTASLHADFTFKQHGDFLFFACKQAYLRTIASNKFKSFRELASSIYRENTEKTNTSTLTEEGASLFASKSGIDRFGGLKKLKENSTLIIGNKPINTIRKFWQIDNQLSLPDFMSQDINQLKEVELITIPGILSTSEKQQVIIDINPGSRIDLNANPNELNVPRSLLTISAIKDANIRQTDTPAIFAMSNFNKAPYIAGALYSITMQTHANTHVEIIDDISTDNSTIVIEKFSSMIDREKMKINFSINSNSKGTYWIRNSIIHKSIDTDCTYFVNDSDDFSCSQRANIQLAVQEKLNGSAAICFGDIVRVDSQFSILPLDGKVERYGTASLSAPTSIHKTYGYYENIRKNADTEFIERLRHYSGKQATKWFRYPVLFQPFDGNNLTSDIYIENEHSIEANLGTRKLHRDLFSLNHHALDLSKLPSIYGFPVTIFSEAYTKELKSFLVEKTND